MAGLTFTSEFRPLSFAERIAPLELYKKEFDKREEQYYDLIEQAEIWKDIANRENSPEAYAMYQRYSDDLSHAASSFMDRGLNLNTGRTLMGLKRRYYQDIEPIKKASEAFDKATEYREQTIARDPSAVFVKNYTSIDDFLHGKKANNEFVSAKDLQMRVAAKAEKLGKALFSDPTFTREPKFAQHLLMMQRNGYSPEEMLAAIQNSPTANKYLTNIYEEELKSVGIDRFTGLDRLKLEEAAKAGMYAGLQAPVHQAMPDGEYVNAYQRQSLANERARIALEKEQNAISWYNAKKTDSAIVKEYDDGTFLVKEGNVYTRQQLVDGKLTRVNYSTPNNASNTTSYEVKLRRYMGEQQVMVRDEKGGMHWVNKSLVPRGKDGKLTNGFKFVDNAGNTHTASLVLKDGRVLRANGTFAGTLGQDIKITENKSYMDRPFYVPGKDSTNKFNKGSDAHTVSLKNSNTEADKIYTKKGTATAGENTKYNRIFDSSTGQFAYAYDKYGNKIFTPYNGMINIIETHLQKYGYTLDNVNIYYDSKNNELKIVDNRTDPWKNQESWKASGTGQGQSYYGKVPSASSPEDLLNYNSTKINKDSVLNLNNIGI